MSYPPPAPRPSETKTSMKYVNLGKSGLQVSKIVLGCMQYGSKEPWMITDHDEGIKQLKYAYDKGINSFDTANIYSDGESEVIVGKFLKQHDIPRESVVIMTKTYHSDGKLEEKGPAGWTNQRGLSRKRIFASVKGSLERLGLDYIDLLQCHRFDYETPIEETMRALHDVVQSGMVRYVGMSSCWAWQFQIMQQYAIQKDLTPFISMQNQHSAMYREEEREMMPMLKYFGVGTVPWGPMAGGLLTRPSKDMEGTVRGQNMPKDGRGKQPGDKRVIDAVEAIAKDKNVTMAEVALAWSCQSPWVTAPIVGIKSAERLDELLKAMELTLTDEEIKRIDEAYEPVKVRGHQ